MTYYYTTKEEAQQVADKLEVSDDRVAYCKAELEPNNGWVVVAVPKVIDITDLSSWVEIRHPNGRRLSPRPSGHKRIAPVSQKKSSPGAGGGPPVKGATAKVWEIADKVFNEKGAIDRSAIIAACTEAGINPATAATQFSKWKKTKQ